LAQVGVVLVQEPEKLEYPGRSQLGALVLVKPETLAGKADIQGDLAIELALEADEPPSVPDNSGTD
jgi:hypothetical protein